MNPHYPDISHIHALRALWQEAFGDSDAFLDGFFRTGFSPRRCRCIVEDGSAKCALYWFDCTMGPHRYAYLYAVATAKNAQHRGLCTALMKDTHSLLKNLGYAGVILVPGEAELFRFYEKQGYRVCCTVGETRCTAIPGESKPIAQDISTPEYAALRRRMLPAGGVVQEGAALEFLSGFARFVRGDHFLMACTVEGRTLICHELLGAADPGAVIFADGCTEGRFRTPGAGRDFAMFLPLCPNATAPGYFGLALD